jgi:uncharacterized membrane protein YcaP (DUF421 family)
VSASVWGVVGISLASLVVLAVLLTGLVRQLKRLSGSLRAFQDGVQPLAARIVADGEIAREGMERLSASAGRLKTRGGAGPGEDR